MYTKLLGGTDVRADHIEGYEQPLDIGRRRPDVTAEVDGVFWAIECERCDALDNAETGEQIVELYNSVTAAGGRFAVYVPLRCRFAAEVRLRELGLPAQDIVVLPPLMGTGKFSGER